MAPTHIDHGAKLGEVVRADNRAHHLGGNAPHGRIEDRTLLGMLHQYARPLIPKTWCCAACPVSTLWRRSPKRRHSLSPQAYRSALQPITPPAVAAHRSKQPGF